MMLTVRNVRTCLYCQSKATSLITFPAWKMFPQMSLLTLATFSEIMQMFYYQLLSLTEQWLPLNTERAQVTAIVLVSCSAVFFVLNTERVHAVLKTKSGRASDVGTVVHFKQGRPGILTRFDLSLPRDEDRMHSNQHDGVLFSCRHKD